MVAEFFTYDEIKYEFVLSTFYRLHRFTEQELMNETNKYRMQTNYYYYWRHKYQFIRKTILWLDTKRYYRYVQLWAGISY